MNGYDVASEEFVSLVESLELQDLPLVGSEFTFFENGQGGAKSRLHRFLIRYLDSGWSRGLCNNDSLSFRWIICLFACLR